MCSSACFQCGAAAGERFQYEAAFRGGETDKPSHEFDRFDCRMEFLGRGLVEQHVRRETGFGRVVGAIRFVRAVDAVVARAGIEVGMPVLVLRLGPVRRVAEWYAACVDVQGSGPMFQQVVRERAVQWFACEADGLVRGLQLAVPTRPRF